MPAPTGPTPSQTVGPFFASGLGWMGPPQLVPPGPGTVSVGGLVLDGDGAPVPDAVVEVCQPEPAGGFARCLVDHGGRWQVLAPAPGPGSSPLNLTVFARGLLNRLVTRCYLPGPGVEDDPVLALVPAERRHTLLAVADGDGYRLDLRLQGPDETVWFAW